jgi:eukaryotic-like serine/threonine-protein kinase
VTEPTVDPATDAPAESLAGGRYRLGEVLGQGGMATVRRARDTRLGVDRAIKLLAPGLAHRSRILARFEAEARAMARIAHPSIVRVYDIADEGGIPFIVMEILEGGTLWEWVEAHGTMPERMACGVLRPVLDAIGAAHEAGVIHRDIKPQNILLTSSGEARITDFGIAQLQDPTTGGGMTKTGTVMGTWGFMAPEQRNSARRVDARSDVYALGATLASLVTGRVPVDLFIADQDEKLLEGVSEPLAEVVRRATRYTPSDRYPDMASLAQALDALQPKLSPTPEDTPALGLRAPVGRTMVPPSQGDTAPRVVAEEREEPTGTLVALLGDGESEDVAAAPTQPDRRGRQWGFALVLGVGVLSAAAFQWYRASDQAPAVDAPTAVQEEGGGNPVAPPPDLVATPEPTNAAGEAPVQPTPSETPAEGSADIGAEPAAGTGSAAKPPTKEHGSNARPDRASPPPADASRDDEGSHSAPDAPPPADGSGDEAGDESTLEGAGGTDGSGAAEAAPPPLPAPAHVSASGGVSKLWLVPEAGGPNLSPGDVPAGRYTVMAVFKGRKTATPAATLDLAPGQAIELACDTRFLKCRPSP